MVSKDELQKVKEELMRITGFIADHGMDEELQDTNVTFACNVADTIDWFLGETPTDYFMSDAYLDIDKLRGIVRKIEGRTGEKLEEYE